MKTDTDRGPSRLKRGSVLGALGAAAALVMSAIVPTLAHAAPPEAGTYEGTSTAYTDAPFSFEIDADGRMSNFDAMSYCFDGQFTQFVTWAGGPAAPIEAGQSFDLEWQITDDGFGSYYELQGTVNADGTASGTGRAGFLPTGTCGGAEFDWTASLSDGGGSDPGPQEPTIVLEKESYYDHEIQRVGIMIRGENFPADTDVEITIHQVSNNDEKYSTTVRSDANGEVYDRFIGWLEHQPLPGGIAHRLTLSAEGDSGTITEEETFKAIPGGNSGFQRFDAREMTVTPDSVSQSALATEGVRIESTDMDGRERTAELIINGKVVGEVPVTEIADEFGEVAHDYIDDSLPVGEHEAALRTVHPDGGLNPTTWERVAWDTFTVTEDTSDPDPVEVTAQAPTRDGNTITIPTVDGVTYLDAADTVLTGTVTLEEDQTLTVTAVADEGYILTDGTHEWTFEYEDDTTPDPDPDTIPGTAPSEDDLDPALEGAITAPDTAEPGETITIVIDGAAEGDEVGVWLFSDPVYLGTQTVNAAGAVTATIPTETEEGDHKIAAWAAGTEAQIGWDTLAVAAADDADEGDDQDGGSNGGDDTNGADDTGSDDTSASDGGLAKTGTDGTGFAVALGVLLLFGAGAMLMRRRTTV